MKKLGELLLPDSLQWIDRYAVSPVAQTVVQTLAGTPVAFHRQGGGTPITLTASKETTWLSHTTTEALLEMAAQAGAIYPLVWEEVTLNVGFRHHQPPALDLTPVWPHHTQFVGTIRLTGIVSNPVS
ncbi:MAG: hypothetical protein HQL72_00435 [Magnetococcales bacterium]|nr:hypothetical protein [Magnetococcales bacterium]